MWHINVLMVKWPINTMAPTHMCTCWCNDGHYFCRAMVRFKGYLALVLNPYWLLIWSAAVPMTWGSYSTEECLHSLSSSLMGKCRNQSQALVYSGNHQLLGGDSRVLLKWKILGCYSWCCVTGKWPGPTATAQTPTSSQTFDGYVSIWTELMCMTILYPISYHAKPFT